MKVSSSTYLSEIKPLLKELTTELSKTYPYVSVLACDSYSKRFVVFRGGTSLFDDEDLTDRGFVVRVYDNINYAECSFSRITKELLPDIVNKVKKAPKTVSEALPAGITEASFPLIPEEQLECSYSSDYAEEPEDEKILELLTGLHEAGKKCDERIIDCRILCNYQFIHKVFISESKDLEQNLLWTTGAVIAVAPKGDDLVSTYRPVSCLGGMEILRELNSIVPEAVGQTIALMESEPIVPGEYDCICSPDVTGMIVHEAFGHGVEMDMFVKDRALAAKNVGEYVASPLITMHDTACAVSQAAHFMFDDEGTNATDTVIIDKGILKTGINDRLSAMALNCRFSGNGRRESTKRKAYTRMTNTFFEPGKDKLEDMIASIKYGFLLEDAESGMEDPKNWGIQCIVKVAKEIKDGRLTGKIFSPIMLTGFVPDLLKSISMVSDDFQLSGSGFCGKGHKEWVKVSDGGPYIKAKIRLG